MSTRVFFAVFPSSLQRRLGGVEQVLGAAMPPRGLRPVPASNWHVTLRFVGHVRDEQLGALDDVAATAALACEPGKGHTGGVLYLPQQPHARVVAVAVDSGGLLEQLAGHLEQGLVAAGFAPADHAYTPHLTLARLRRQLRDLPHPDQLEPPTASFAIPEFGLYRSVTAAGGAEYSLLARYALGAAALQASG